MINVYASVNGSDLGSVSKEVIRLSKDIEKELPRGSRLVIRGQVQTMNSSFLGLGIGLIWHNCPRLFADRRQFFSPGSMILHHHTALPGALAGICWILLLTHTTLNVPSLTGAIMCMGVATANSILMVSFAREQMNEGRSPFEAALEAGFVRIRPVIMTALAMMIGMIPMAIGLGEGGEQTLPWGAL